MDDAGVTPGDLPKSPTKLSQKKDPMIANPQYPSCHHFATLGEANDAMYGKFLRTLFAKGMAQTLEHTWYDVADPRNVPMTKTAGI